MVEKEGGGRLIPLQPPDAMGFKMYHQVIRVTLRSIASCCFTWCITVKYKGKEKDLDAMK